MTIRDFINRDWFSGHVKHYSVSGVFAIINICNNKAYIGKSNNIYKAWRENINALINHSHHSNSLQQDFDRFSDDSFILVTLCITKDNIELIRRKYVLEYNSVTEGYNST